MTAKKKTAKKPAAKKKATAKPSARAQLSKDDLAKAINLQETPALEAAIRRKQQRNDPDTEAVDIIATVQYEIRAAIEANTAAIEQLIAKLD